MAQDVELNEPLIDVFKSTNINAVQRVLDRAQRNADRAAKAQRRESKPSKKPGALTKAINAAMSAYGRSSKNGRSIRLTAPDTGGRPYHFAYTHVTKGERRTGKAGTEGGGAGDAGGTGAGKGTKKAAGGKAGGKAAGGRPTANTAEAAHQVYTERDAAVDKDARDLGPELAPSAPGQGRQGQGTEPEGIDASQEQDGPEAGQSPGLQAPGPQRKRRPSEIAADAGLARAYAEGLVAEGQGITERASEAAAQAYIEDPSKRPGALMGTTASFGTIGATLEERMAFWDLVHEHESVKGGRTQSRLVLELPHEATAEDRHEIVRRYTDEFRRKGIPFWASIHAPTEKNDSRNHHAHVVFTDRPMQKMPHPETGKMVWDFTVAETYKSSSRHTIKHYPYRQNRDPEMRDRGYVKLARARFSTVVNEVMQASSNAVRYDPRSYKDMGLDVAPMKNVTRILADKLDKRAFVVMDAEWTRRMVDAEVKAAAARRDATFIKLQDAERNMQDAAREVIAANKANARLPKHLRITPGQVMVKGVAERIMGKILTVRRDRLATQFVDEATLSALQQVAEATSPTQGKGKKNRAHDPATAPDPEDLAALHAAALEEIAAQRLGARSRQARASAREAELTKEWKSQGLGSKPGGPPKGPAGPGGTGPGHTPKPPAPNGGATIQSMPGLNTGTTRKPQPESQKTTSPNIHGVIHLPGPTRPAWQQESRKAPARSTDPESDLQASQSMYAAMQRLPQIMQVLQRRLEAIKEKFQGDGVGFVEAVRAERQVLIDSAAARRRQLAGMTTAQADQRPNPAAAPVIKGPAVGTERTAEDVAKARRARLEQPATRTPLSPTGQVAPTSTSPDPEHSVPNIQPEGTRAGAVPQTENKTADAPRTMPEPSRAEAQPLSLPGRLDGPAALTRVSRAAQVMHVVRIPIQPPASLERDPQMMDGPQPPAQSPDRQAQGAVRAPDQPQLGASAEPPAATPKLNPTAPAGDLQTPEEAAAEEERKKRRKAILAARRRNRGPGL